MSKIEGLNNKPLGVDAKNRAFVLSASADSMIDQMLDGKAFRVEEVAVTPTGANDFMAFRNISSEFAIMTRLGLYSTAAETFTGELTLNYTLAGTNATPDEEFNRSGAVGSPLSNKMTAVVGVTVTGKSTVLSTPLTFISAATTRNQNMIDDGAVIVIPPGYTFTLSASAGGNPLTEVNAEVHFISAPVDGQ